MFTLTQFDQHGHHVTLTFPEESDAGGLFSQIKKDRVLLSKWMPWTKATKNVHQEEHFMQYSRQQIIDKKLFLLVIKVDGIPAGMIDLHDFDEIDHHASVGYWLGSDFQGLGIMTRALAALFATGFNDLHLYKIQILADVANEKSRAVPTRLHCHLDGVLPAHLYLNDAYHDAAIYSLTRPEYQSLIEKKELNTVDDVKENS
ncbi:GNAT family N-acetyltransferase [Schleiferilactobacillus perolens]|jgi:ribosomal-protein-serine acetyltransferase|uniref:GNAT family N-acetyltransferase n=1 Tax=Schleiferilactobacillus perolens TaxID=100468 RepID=UPI002354A2A6|nr:GNAT family protein [Schleiferilactobacillus perolens]MCI2172229.1 GNAT family N-acetyltransferase [Schleiferilactobacillus perolens]